MLKINIVIVFLLISSFADAAIRPADGLWATSDDPAIGSGLMLTTQNDTTLISVFTYDQDGKNAWYIASGQVDDEGVLEAELRQTENGTNMVEDNPQSASLTEATRTLRIDFSGTQVGSFSIDGSEMKSVKANYYGKQVFYGFPALTGQWLVGNAESGESYILDLSMVTGPNSHNDSYVSSHPSTDGWLMKCFLVTIGFVEPKCQLSADSEFTDEDLYVEVRNIGSQRMVLNSPENGHKFHAFRFDNNRRLLPNDGFWRPYDDPAVGSGLVLHTQGDITVALLYSYDDEGTPTWQIASGVFDEDGFFSADLLTPSGGTAMENETPETASFSEQVQTLEIQMQGLELATFSVDGSTPKAIQNTNFGAELFNTEQFKVMDEPFKFPHQVGSWVLVDQDLTISSVWQLERENPNCCQSPPDPNYFDSVGYTNRSFDNNSTVDPNFSVHFNCVKTQIPYSNYIYPITPYCYGNNYRDEENKLVKIYFEDIGYDQFRYYIGPRDSMDFYGGFDEIDRSSNFYQLFRLND